MLQRRVAFDPSRYVAEELLKDGGSIHMRAIRPDDKERLQDFHGRLSERSVYFRFFGIKRECGLHDDEETGGSGI